ncbi:unnamed protein product [Lactuca virosa]|uniref:Uncharacterized protein n=1 Tax=Lactuca virosa TaxID=75947 RepID=A0AAU9P7D1_9ASTR|nr:unnamed protein product [Lactuca virosa]
MFAFNWVGPSSPKHSIQGHPGLPITRSHADKHSLPPSPLTDTHTHTLNCELFLEIRIHLFRFIKKTYVTKQES